MSHDVVVNIVPPPPITLGYAQGGAVGPQGPVGATGAIGPANKLTIGTVLSGPDAAATLSAQVVANGTASQTLSLVLPQGATGERGLQGEVGPAGPPNVLVVGSVSTTSAATASVSITGTSPSQQISFVVPRGPQGIQGEAGPYTTVLAGTATTGAPGSQVKVDTVTSGGTVTLNFTIPRGADGTANLSDETPQPLGTPSAGAAASAARADHRHAVPVIAYGSLTGVPTAFTPSPHTHSISEVANLQASLDSKQPAGSYPTLDGNGKISSSFLPSYVDDVVEYAASGSFPATGEAGKLYVALDTRKLWRWSGTGYVEIAASPGSTDAVPEGSTNKYFTVQRAADAAPVQSVNGKTGAVTIEAGGIAWSTVPTATTTITKAGSISYDPNYVYVATDVDTWRRAGLEDWTTPTITINTQPGNQTASGGEAVFTVTASVTQGAELLYQWQRQAGGTGSWANVSGGLSSSLTLSNLQYAVNNGDKYRVIITSGAAGTGGSAVNGWLPAVVVELTPTASATSDPATLTVLAAISITLQPQSVTLVSDTTATFSVAATTPGSGLAYQWQSSPDGSNWTTISGATNSTLSFTGLNQSNDQTRYRCVVSSSGYDDVTSVAAKLTVNPITVTKQPASMTATPGTGTTPNYNATLTVAGTSPAGPPTLQWQVSTDSGSTWSDVSGATSSSLSLSALEWSDSGKRYRARLNKTGWSEVTSNSATVSVPQDVIAVTQQPANTTASVSPYSLTQYSLPSGTWADISVANGKFFATPNDQLGGDYIATSDNGVTWTKRIAALPYSGYWSKVIYGNGTYLTFLVSGSVSGTWCATSTDGLTWTARQISATTGLAVYSPVFLGGGGGWFVAFNSQTGAALRHVQSADGINWTTVSHSFFQSPSAQNVCPSADGTQAMIWTFGTGATALASVTQSGLGQMTSSGSTHPLYSARRIIHDGTTFVAYGPDNGNMTAGFSAKYSTGTTWTRQTFGADIYAVARLGGRYVAMTSAGIASSNDGVNWSLRQSILNANGAGESDIAATTAGFVANGYTGSAFLLYTSGDGLTWTSRTSGSATTKVFAVSGNRAVIGTNPGNGFVVDVGGVLSASLSAAASTLFGSPDIQWQRSTDGGSTWANVSGATSSPLSFAPASGDNGSRYRAVFSKSQYTTVNSNAATLTVP